MEDEEVVEVEEADAEVAKIWEEKNKSHQKMLKGTVDTVENVHVHAPYFQLI